VCKSLLVFHWNYVSRTASEIFSVKEWRDLETGGGVRSRSLEMAPFDRPYTTFYRSAIVCIALSDTVFELLDVEKYRDLEIRVRNHWRSFKLVPFEILGAISYSPSIVTMALSCISSEIKPDICQKSWFFISPLHSAPSLWAPVGILPSRLVWKK